MGLMATCTTSGCWEQHGLIEGECAECIHARSCSAVGQVQSQARVFRWIVAYVDVCLDGGKNHSLEEIKRMAENGVRRSEPLSPPLAPCPCGEPNGGPPCTFDRPCSYGRGKPRERWS